MRDWCLGRVVWVADRGFASTENRKFLQQGAELRGKISTMPGLNRFLRVTPGGLLRIDKARIRAEENLDGKYLLRCADPQPPAEDIAAGYKQLLEVERGWRDMKSVLDLRPVYHRLEERIRAHVILCWLALLLIRIAETTTGQTWNTMRRELDRIHLGTFTGPAGAFKQRTEITKPARDLLARLIIEHPARSTSSLPPPPEPPAAHNAALEKRPAARRHAIPAAHPHDRRSRRAELRGTQARRTCSLPNRPSSDFTAARSRQRASFTRSPASAISPAAA